MKKIISDVIDESIKNLNSLKENGFEEILLKISKDIIECIRNGNKIMIAGNGGSASDAQHFAGELVGRFLLERKPYPAIALNTDTSVMTCIANDYSYDEVISRQVEALGNKGDIFIGISTSGNSSNIVNAIKVANKNGIKTIGLIGKTGGEMKELCETYLLFPYNNTARVQEHHILSIHLLCDIVERELEKNQ